MKKHLIRVLSLLLAVALLLPLLSGTAVSATRTTSERAPKFKSYLTTGYNSAAITENGDLYMWGENSAGEVGNNTTEIQLTPTKVLSDVIFVDLCRSYRGLSNNYDTVAAITENGDLYMWGGNSSGEVGNGLNKGNQLFPAKVMENVAYVDIETTMDNYGSEVGYDTMSSTAAITKNGDLYMWGNNWIGQIGCGKSGGTVYTPTKILSNISSVQLGLYTIAAISNDQSLYVWGENAGNGSDRYGSTSTPFQVMDDIKCFHIRDLPSCSEGFSQAAALTNSGDLYVWGYNNGTLGNGSTAKYQSTPVKILSNVDTLPSFYSTLAAITQNKDLYMWGSNGHGQVGNGTTENQLTPVKVLSNVSFFSLDWNTSAAVTTDGGLYIWGYNEYAQVGNGTTEDQLTPVKILGNVSSVVSNGPWNKAAITTDGSLYIWGYNWAGQVGNGTTEDQHTPAKVLNNAASVSFYGNATTASVTTDGSLYVWGNNGYGQVGNNTTESQLVPTKVLNNVSSFSPSLYTSAAVTTDGGLYIWGMNEYGQVGNGTTANQLTPYMVEVRAVVPKFELGKDNFSFINSAEDFLTPSERIVRDAEKNGGVKPWSYAEFLTEIGVTANYQITDASFDRLMKKMAPTVQDALIENRYRIFGGSCFGMSVVMAIRSAEGSRLPINKIDSSAATTYQLKAPNISWQTEDLINYYQLMYKYPYFVDRVLPLSKLTEKDYSAAVKQLIAGITDDAVPTVVAIAKAGCEGAHAVILLDVIEEDDTRYCVKVYDPNYQKYTTMIVYKKPQNNSYVDPDGVAYQFISILYNGANLSGAEEDAYIYVYNYVDLLDALDMRNYFNPDEDHTDLGGTRYQSDYYNEPIIWVAGNTDVSFNGYGTSLNYVDGYVTERKGVYGPYPSPEGFDETYEKSFLLDTVSPGENYEFTFKTTEPGCNIGIDMMNWAIRVSSGEDITVNMNNKTCTALMNSNQSTDISTMVSWNDVDEACPWYRVAVDVKDATTLSVTPTSDGIILSSDNLTDVEVVMQNDNETDCTEIRSDSDAILVTTDNTGDIIIVEVRNNPFVDVAQGRFYYKPVLWAVENGITSGMDATHFMPERSCTRGQVVTFLWRAMGEPEPRSTSCPFVDVGAGRFYYKAVLWAYENGITAGMDATHFAPEDTVTRGQFVTFLWRAEGKPAASGSNPFTDVNSGRFYYNAVLWAAQNGITSGMTPTTFAPDRTCTRGQVVTFLYRDLAE